MEQTPYDLVTRIRSASRELVRELGFMNRTLAGTDLSASAVHAIIEIGASNRLKSKDLCEKMLLEKSTISRLVKSLTDGGSVQEFRSSEDARIKHLRLTRQGEKTLAAINTFAAQQVAAATDPLSNQSQQNILAGLQDYATALRASRQTSEAVLPYDQAIIEEGYTPGLIGRIVEMHGSYYSRRAGFGAEFETKVASGLAEFTARLEKPNNSIWYALRGEKIVGSISIDGTALGEKHSHLRWFIVDDEIRGTGAGRMLIEKALAFCDDRGFRETHLWTFEGLDAARKLYEKAGFSLAEEFHGDRWGIEVVEQKFVRPLGGATPANAASETRRPRRSRRASARTGAATSRRNGSPPPRS